MLIAQVSDTHIVPPGELLFGTIDSAANLARVVERIQQLDTRPDCVLATGDLTQQGEPESYRLLRELLAPLDVPVYVIPGNHDKRETLRQAYSECSWMPSRAGAPIAYAVDLGPMRVLALDTLLEGAEHGVLDDDQLDWLAARLDEAPDLPTLIMLHHPPINCGVRLIDTLKLARPERLGAIVARHAHIERVLCGHLHRTLHARWCGTSVSVAPSTAEQMRSVFQPDAAVESIAEPPGFQLHFWHPVDRLITHTLSAHA